MFEVTQSVLRVEQKYHQPGWRRSMEDLQRVLDTQVSADSAVLHADAELIQRFRKFYLKFLYELIK